LEASKNPRTSKKEFQLVFNEYIQPLIDGEIEEIQVSMKKTSYWITDISNKNISFRKNSGGTGHTLSLATLEKMYEQENTGEIQGLSSYYQPLLEVLLKLGKSDTAVKVERKNYVIIIDEINRANISRVFGELITLIEGDKRSDGEIPMKVTLPSGDKFIVPSNLYIIGTMNTSDKSIALLDIALRRRFEFVPMYPDVTKVKAEYQDIFLKMNKAIKEKKNYDFTIGHAYFMDNNISLEKIINNKVIPLLLEYFMNSEEQVTEILASAGIAIGGWPLKMIV
jgi:5-methylcytosine-specific restriction protein B